MILQNIHSPDDLKALPESELPALASEMRREIIDVVGRNGGHLASNLGVVELSIALHRVFSSPHDAIVWDVSHQCYPHKLLTGRLENFSTLREKDGISGFTRITESPHDFFDAGHASSSISSALGLLSAWQQTGKDGKVIAVIGDGALTGGMAFEGLSHAGQLAKNLIVIVNDNQMSISRNVGSLSRYLSRLTMTDAYQSFRYKFDRAVDYIPYINRHIGKLIYRLKRGLKGMFLTNNLFVDLGFEYVGPLNGHNIEQLERVLRKAAKIPRPVVIHVVTKKGRGYSPAENNPSAFHGVGPFNTSDGVVEKFDALSFTEAFSSKIVSLAEENPKIAAVTAAMSKGTGLDAFSRRFPRRFYDVGIAEEHAITFAGGLAAGGMVPVAAIYSTFMQRSFDQIVEDIALPSRHAVLVMDRAGAVPSDGETHQGIFDISMLLPVPNMCIMSVASRVDLDLCLDWAVSCAKGPVAIRWPKMSCPSELASFAAPVEAGRGLFIGAEEFAPAVSARFADESELNGAKNKKVLFVCTGGMFSECLVASRSLLLGGIWADIYSLRFIKPFDEEYFVKLASSYDAVVFVEDGILTGGIGRNLESVLLRSPYAPKIKTAAAGFPDRFLHNGNRMQILEEAGLDPDTIAALARTLTEN